MSLFTEDQRAEILRKVSEECRDAVHTVAERSENLYTGLCHEWPVASLNEIIDDLVSELIYVKMQINGIGWYK